MKVGSLFSGIGGLDLGLERAGMTVAWQSEIDPYACKVLAKHWPGVPNHGDIKRIDWGTVEPVDVICGGYPCQPFSLASPSRRGTEDPRHLWPWVRDAISALRPRYAILENVKGHLSLGGTTVLGDLATIGYDAQWRVIPAAGVGARHRRDRIIILAYPNSSEQTHGRQRSLVPSKDQSTGDDRTRSRSDLGQVSMGSTRQSASHVADPCGSGWVRWREPFACDDEEVREHARRSALYWEVEPAVGRVAYGVPRRMDRLRGLGNAVVPQVAEYIGRLVMAHAQHSQQ